MYSVSDLQAIISKKVDGFCRVNGDTAILQPVNYIMQLGGKRLRPVLSLMAANLFSDDIDDVIYPALAIEVFHNFTLMHDDIMDNAPIRRGRPTVHEKWNNSTAILSGDVMLIQAYQLLSKAPDDVLKDVLAVFSATAVDVCRGQYMDMEFEQRDVVSKDEYIEMIRLKTSVLLAGSMHIGSIISHATAGDRASICAFGENLGIAFQLWDDYLDAFGDESKTGKQKGGDILAGKKTYLMITAMTLATREQQQVLNPSNRDGISYVNDVLAIFDALGVRELTRGQMSSYHQKAIESLDNVRVEPSRKNELRSLAEQMFTREM